MKSVATLLAVLALGSASHAAYWGVVGDFADLDPAVSTRLAPALGQRGANAVLLNMRGKERGWFLWTKVQKAWEDAHSTVFWDAPSTLAECDRIQGLGDEPETMSGQPLNRGANFLSSKWASEVERTATSMAFRIRSTAGYRIAAPINTSALASDPDAVQSWRKFLAAFFADKSPSQDTNADTATFDSAYNVAYKSWDQVPLFTASELSDPRKRHLQELWIERSQADYITDMCGTLAPLTHDGLSGPELTSLRSPTSDASILASRKFVKRLYASSEDAVPTIDSAAAVFGKRVFAAPLKLAPGNVTASRQRLLKLLPYLDGAFFDFSALAALDEKGETVGFDPAFEVIPQLAPFAGRLQVNRSKVLWVVPADVPATDVLDAYCITEDALALDPTCVDLSQYQAVIYLNSSPCISITIIQRLFDYAVNGGTVLLDGCRIGSGMTLHGRDNGHYWLEDLKLERDKPGPGTTTVKLGDLFSSTVDGTVPYLTATPGKFTEIGEVTDSTGARHPLLFVRKMGKSGKWVYINAPDIRGEFPLLRAIVKDQAAVDLPDRSRARVYTGPACALAIGGRDARTVSIPCAYAEAVVFDIGSLNAFVAKPTDGSITLPDKLQPGEAKLWVVKPYGKPVLLYADGVSDYAGSIDDGVFDGKTLKFKLARRAFVSSPSRPKSLAVGGKEVGFEYNPSQHLLKVTRPSTGGPVEAELTYE